MSQQSIVGRVLQLARADINALTDSADDQRRMLDQLVRAYSAHISAAEQAIAQTIANLRMIEQDQKEEAKAAQQWGKKAQATSKKADELRSTGTIQDANTFDNLARVALERQFAAQGDVATMQHRIDAQNESVRKLKAGLDQMKIKLRDLNRKCDDAARSRKTRAQARLRDTVQALDIMDPASEISRFEEKVRREEARVGGHRELAASALDAQFTSLQEHGHQAEIENRLRALKAGRAVARAGSSRSKAPAR